MTLRFQLRQHRLPATASINPPQYVQQEKSTISCSYGNIRSVRVLLLVMVLSIPWQLAAQTSTDIESETGLVDPGRRIGSTTVETPGIDARLTPAPVEEILLDNESISAELPDQEHLYSFIEQGMDLWNVPGMAVTVVNSERVLFRQSFGKTAVRDGLVIDEHTLFAAASTTKAMVVMAVLMLQDEGKLSLSDPITQHLPEIQFSDPVLNRDVTIADLLAHRTGLPSTDFWTFMQDMPLDEQISRLRFVPAEASLRSRLIYQNTMYELIGMLIQRLTGERWDSFLTHRLWQPIGMRETYGSRSQIPAVASHVLPYYDVGGDLVQARWDFAPDLADAAGSTWTSLHDMGLWAQFLLRDGVTETGERLISATGMEQMFTAQQLATPEDFYPTVALTKPNWRSYGLGWFQQDYQGRQINYHTGSLSGLIALIGLDRVNDKAVVVLGNRDHAEMRHAILWNVMDQDDPETKRDWNQEVFDLYELEKAKSEERWNEIRQLRIANANPGLPLQGFSGRYTSKMNGDVVVVYSDRRLLFKTALKTLELRHWHMNSFVVEYPNQNTRDFAEFHIGMDGKVKSLNILGDTFNRLEDGPDLD